MTGSMMFEAVGGARPRSPWWRAWAFAARAGLLGSLLALAGACCALGMTRIEQCSEPEFWSEALGACAESSDGVVFYCGDDDDGRRVFFVQRADAADLFLAPRRALTVEDRLPERFAFRCDRSDWHDVSPLVCSPSRRRAAGSD